MPYIAKDFINQKLLPAVHIEELIGQYVTLKPRGSSLVCCCPFHHEKTPSFTVTPSKQMFYCFGCKEHGNAVDFLMKYKNEGFVEAIEELSQFAGLEVEYEEGSRWAGREDYRHYYELMDKAAAAFTRELEKSPRAQDYFYKKRGLNRNTVITCRLGYAPPDWNFMDKLCTSPQDREAYVRLGLIVQREDKSFAFFRDRVMIPIADSRGRIVSFGGRVLGEGEPKYLNTAESPIFRKRQELFGLYDALQASRNRPARLVIVEGYMDVISLKQAGITYSVASLGTATTVEQFKTMFRYSKQVICCYDGDNAGRRAAWHALETATPVLKEGLEMRFAFLPPEHDPDSLVRELGQSAFTKTLDEALSYPEFLTAHLAKEYDLADLGQRGSFITAVLHKARVIAYEPLQAMVLEKLSEMVGMESERLFKMMDNVQLSRQEAAQESARENGADNPEERQGNRRYLTTPMRKLIAFLLQQPTVVGAVYTKFRLDELAALMTEFKLKGAEEAVYLLTAIKQNPQLTPGAIIELMRGTPKETYCRLLIDAEFIPKRPDGSEFSLEARAELLAKIIKDVLREPLRRFVEELKIKGPGMTAEDSTMMTEINRALLKLTL